MSRNIKEIGKELMGKSLNSYHRKTGLPHLEKNNEMQDGILNGILSQVNNAYIEKTEQSNVIHLENSGDGVVVLDNIEGNTKLHIVNEPIKEGLVCWLEGIDGITGDDTLVDRSDKNNNGTLVGVDHNVNKWGFKCLELGRSSSCVRIPNPTLNLEQYTVELTFREYGVGYWCGLFGNTSSDGGGTSVYKSNANYISTYPYITNGEYYSSNGVNVITTMTVVFDCINKIMKFYENGVLKKVVNTPSLIVTTSNTMVVGARRDNAVTDNGYMDSRKIDIYSFKVYDRCLTDDEIATNYHQQLTSIELQSSFEENKEDDKYKIEILSQTGNNLYNLKTVNYDWGVPNKPTISPSTSNLNYHCCEYFDISPFRGKTIYAGTFRDGVLRSNGVSFSVFFDENNERIGGRDGITPNGVVVPTNAKLMSLMQHCGNQDTLTYINRDKYVVKLEPFVSGEKLVEHKSNKIKLLINEPLRSTPYGIKDKLCVKDNKLVVERNCGTILLDGTEGWMVDQCFETYGQIRISHDDFIKKNKKINKLYETTYDGNARVSCDKFAPSVKYPNASVDNLDTIFAGDSKDYALFLKFKNSTLGMDNVINYGLFTQKTKEYLGNNNLTVVYELNEPYYEEVTNEYGEPIILEGYENGTLYIDSMIAPTTTVRYTPKMESIKTLKEVKSDNSLLAYDINDNIIPYMMEVDLMILEKEMDLISSFNKNIRTMEVLDMTSMQKRTQQMLERLIKGKTLTEQECQTRVTTYLNANKITDEQAEELMLLISEVYA